MQRTSTNWLIVLSKNYNSLHYKHKFVYFLVVYSLSRLLKLDCWYWWDNPKIGCVFWINIDFKMIKSRLGILRNGFLKRKSGNIFIEVFCGPIKKMLPDFHFFKLMGFLVNFRTNLLNHNLVQNKPLLLGHPKLIWRNFDRLQYIEPFWDVYTSHIVPNCYHHNYNNFGFQWEQSTEIERRGMELSS